MTSNDFKAEDFSRFLIREFLKKNGFEKTYDQFMLEDSRPKVTMTKNELMRLLGIEALMKKNSKAKQFDTMMDIICDHLVSQKDSSHTSHELNDHNIGGTHNNAISTNSSQATTNSSNTFKMRAGS
jgi:hypothetical protein